MGRIFSSGFELNSNSNGVEWDTTSGSPTIVTTTVRTGTYAGEIPSLTSGVSKFWQNQFSSADATGPYFFRFYFRLHTSVTVNTTIFQFGNNAGTSQPFNIVLTTADKLQVLNTSGTQIGADSAALSKDTWIRIEARYDTTGGVNHVIVEAQINGVNFVSSTTVATVTNVNNLAIGGNLKGESATTGDYFFDDCALNDSTGLNQNTYPGAGQIIHLKPRAAGDNNGFTVQVGGTAGAANNFTRVNEVTPNDATTYNGDAVSGDTDDFAMDATPASIGASDIINCVAIFVRFRAVVAAAEAAFKVRIKKVAAGTVSSSAAITPNSTTWRSNTTAVPELSPLVLYLNPDSSAWTKATLDTMQAGYTISTTNTNAADISSLQVQVDSTPVAVTAPTVVAYKTLLGAGQI